jgi:hypothetical protein
MKTGAEVPMKGPDRPITKVKISAKASALPRKDCIGVVITPPQAGKFKLFFQIGAVIIRPNSALIRDLPHGINLAIMNLNMAEEKRRRLDRLIQDSGCPAILNLKGYKHLPEFLQNRLELGRYVVAKSEGKKTVYRLKKPHLAQLVEDAVRSGVGFTGEAERIKALAKMLGINPMPLQVERLLLKYQERLWEVPTPTQRKTMGW